MKKKKSSLSGQKRNLFSIVKIHVPLITEVLSDFDQFQNMELFYIIH